MLDNYCESKNQEELIEWVPYNELENITNIESSFFYSSICNNFIFDWDTSKLNWDRRPKYMEAMLMNFENLNDLINYEYEILKSSQIYTTYKYFKIFGISKDPMKLNFILIIEYDFLEFLYNYKSTHFHKIFGISKDPVYNNNYVLVAH
ncbi:hypothetical protein C1645_871367, partial [Glomus cerebriforme]